MQNDVQACMCLVQACMCLVLACMCLVQACRTMCRRACASCWHAERRARVHVPCAGLQNDMHADISPCWLANRRERFGVGCEGIHRCDSLTIEVVQSAY